MITVNDLQNSFKGIITKKSTGEKVQVKQILLDQNSREKIANVLNEGCVRGKDNYKLVIQLLAINAEDETVFKKGQSTLHINGNKISSSGTPGNKYRYSGEFASFVREGEFVIFRLGEMEFTVTDEIGTKYKDQIVYSDITAELYPMGEYSYEISSEVPFFDL